MSAPASLHDQAIVIDGLIISNFKIPTHSSHRFFPRQSD